jgi:hypothetical protein
MIQMPRRSITRFFIPMIDVLTLLFCIYLLMPMVRNPEQKQQDERRALEEKVRRLEAELARKTSKDPDMTAQLRAEVERLRREKIKALKDRLAVRVLEIDGNRGELFVRGGDGQEIKSEAEAHRLIEFDRQKQGAAGKRELYYLILYPRDPLSGYPTREQKQKYDHWFEGVALSYDDPGRER